MEHKIRDYNNYNLSRNIENPFLEAKKATEVLLLYVPREYTLL